MIQEKQRLAYQTPDALRPDRLDVSHPLLRLCTGLLAGFVAIVLWWNAAVLCALAYQANTERFKWYQIRDAIPCFIGGCLFAILAYYSLRRFGFRRGD